MKKVKAGLLPLYVELYDKFLEWMHPQVDIFYENVAKKLESEGIEILRSKPCRLQNEFSKTITDFEAQGAQVLITLHLAYSPSLESETPLKECKLPIIVLDTTPDFLFSPTGSTSKIDYDHGMHGVQDMCNLLIRNNVKFKIFVGHWENSSVCKDVADCVKAYTVAEALSKSRVGLIGEPFDGMGDFRIPFDELKRDIGIEVVKTEPMNIKAFADKVDEARIEQLKAEDARRFDNINVSDDLYRAVTRTSLAVKDWYESEKLDSFTLNFLAAGKTTGLRYMVFDRACRAMEEGVGYAGEGDVLTAALVGSLLKGWENSTFVEMFCPSWNDGTVFLSHMGEYNIRIAGKRPVMCERPFPFGDAGNPYALMSPMRSGEAVIINLAPGGNGKYTLIAIRGRMQDVPENSNFNGVVNGWFKPDRKLAEMLKIYSENGGTHHSAMVYGIDPEVLQVIADKFGWGFVSI